MIVAVEWFRAWKIEFIVFVCDHNFLPRNQNGTHSLTHIRIVFIYRTMVHCLYKHTRMLLFFPRYIFLWKQPIRIHHITKAMKSFFLPVSIRLGCWAYNYFYFVFTAVVAVCCAHLVLFTFFSMSIFFFIKTLFVCLPKGNLIPTEMCLYYFVLYEEWRMSRAKRIFSSLHSKRKLGCIVWMSVEYVCSELLIYSTRYL